MFRLSKLSFQTKLCFFFLMYYLALDNLFGILVSRAFAVNFCECDVVVLIRSTS